MEKAVELLKKGRDVNILNSLEAVFSCISDPFESTDDEQIHRKLGDNLARLGGGYELIKFLQYLHRVYESGIEKEHVLCGITLIRKTCRNYSQSSSKLCEQFGQSGLLKLLLCDIDGVKEEAKQKRKPMGSERYEDMLWYHYMLPRVNATQLLHDEGDFLLRREEGTFSQLVLSVKCDGTDKHILITEQDQQYRFEEKAFTKVSDLIESYVNSGTPVISSTQILLKRPVVRRSIFDGTYIGSQLQQAMEDKTLAYMVWYHGCLSRVKANELLKDEGDFLVRRKEDSSGLFVLSVKSEGRAKHSLIEEQDHKYMFSNIRGKYDSISELIEAYMRGSGSLCREELRGPVTARRNIHDSLSESSTGFGLQKTQRRWLTVMSAFVTLYHCAKVAQNRQIYKDLHAVERLSPILRSEDLTLAMGAMLILSEIVEEQDNEFLTADRHLISFILSTLKTAVTKPKLKGNMKACAYSIADLSRALGNIAVNNKNKVLIVDLGGVQVLVDLMNQNCPDVQESAASTLWFLSHLERKKPTITSSPTLTSLQRSENTAVMQVAKKVLTKINPTCQEIDEDEGVDFESGGFKVEISGTGLNAIMFAMRETVELLAKGSEVDIMIAVQKVYGTIILPFNRTSDERLRQRFGDHLASLGGGHELTKLMQCLQEMGDMTPSKQTWIGITLLRSLCWNYSDNSLKLCKQFGQSGLLELVLKDIDRFGPTGVVNEKRLYLLKSAFGVLHNCAKATENKQVYRDIRAIERIAPFMKSQDRSLAIGALLTLSYIIEDNKIDLLEADIKLIAYILEILKRALGDPGLKSITEGGTYSALEITTGLGNIAVNDTNKGWIVKLGGVPLLIDLLKKDRPDVQESAANTLWTLAQADKHKGNISFVPGAINTLTSLCKSKITAEEADQHLPQKGAVVTESYAEGSRNHWDYQRYFLSQSSTYATAQAVITIEVTNFIMLEDNPLKITGFHLDGAVSPSRDIRVGGVKLSECPGHFSDDSKPRGFDTKQIFLSPSIRYSGCDVYAPESGFFDKSTKKSHKARVVFQVCISPTSYKVGPQTIDAKSEIDPKFSNQEIEWFTKERGAVIPYGLLVKVE
ncbi:uncharacterized protein [Ptychodera flava]|uniref:uncharacterized protein n=1 Tax=Ptychodera flava TaxID=63121 RepID=UPI00396A878D